MASIKDCAVAFQVSFLFWERDGRLFWILGVVLELLVRPILTTVLRDPQQSQSALSGLSNPIPSIHPAA
jgi:hypothetical protein